MHLQSQTAPQEQSAADPTKPEATSTQQLQYANVPAGTPLKRQATPIDNNDIDFWQRYRCYR